MRLAGKVITKSWDLVVTGNDLARFFDLVVTLYAPCSDLARKVIHMYAIYVRVV